MSQSAVSVQQDFDHILTLFRKINEEVSTEEIAATLTLATVLHRFSRAFKEGGPEGSSALLVHRVGEEFNDS